MSDIIAVPTVEQINLEHQLANSKANEAVQHATNCGLMMLQVKASLSHGEWLPWLNGEIESGRLEVKSTQARVYMRVASNKQRGVYLPETTSIRAALELLSDKEPDTEQADLIPADIEAERKARIAAEQKIDAERERREAAERVLLETQQRASEFGQESNERRLKIRDLETHISDLERRIDAFDSEAKPEPVTVEKIIEKVIEKPVIPPEFASLEAAISAKKAELNRLGHDATEALNRNKTIFDYRAELQQEVGDLEAMLSHHKAAEREMVEHKRLTDEAIRFTAIFLAELEALEHAPNAAQRSRWQQAQQQFSSAAQRINESLRHSESAPLEGELLECAA